MLKKTTVAEDTSSDNGNLFRRLFFGKLNDLTEELLGRLEESENISHGKRDAIDMEICGYILQLIP